MSFAQASLLFLVQFAFGSLITFVLADRAALGPKYFKLGGWLLVACYGLALSVAWNQPGRPLVPPIGAAAALTLAFASVCGWDRPRLETLLLVAALLAGAAAVVLAATIPGNRNLFTSP